MKKIILLAALLLASCSTPVSSARQNPLEKYLDNLGVEHILLQEQCTTSFGLSKPSSFRYDGITIPVNCRVMFQIVPLENGFEGERYFYLVYEQSNEAFYFANSSSIITNDGKLLTHQQYFGGK